MEGSVHMLILGMPAVDLILLRLRPLDAALLCLDQTLDRLADGHRSSEQSGKCRSEPT